MAEGGAEDTASEAHTGNSDVFISYASQDAPVADSVVAALERQGVQCWIAPRDMRPGEFYADAIVRAINKATILVLLLTENAVCSPHVLREVERASAKRHPIVSLRIGAVTLPPAFEYFLSASHWLDARSSGVDTALPKLIDAVKLLVAPSSGIGPGSPSEIAQQSADLFPLTPGRKPGPRLRRRVIALGAVIACGLGYFAVDRLWPAKHHNDERPVVAMAPSAAPSAPAIYEKSVAVLPFVDMSEKKDQEYFSDGLSEELIDMLTKIADLQVPARTSSFYFKGKQTTIADIAKALNVSHVLEGSVRKSGNKLRVTAQLIRADNGYHLWSQTYDRPFGDIFKMQDEIAGAVVEALKVSLLAGAIPDTAGTQNPETYALYLQGRHFFQNAATKQDLESAINCLQRALRLDPKFARAWALLARVRAGYFAAFLNSSQLEVRREAEDDAKRALALDPNQADSHLAMAAIYDEIDWDWKAAEGEFSQALHLEPGNTRALAGLANISLTQDRLGQALQYAKSAVVHDPLNAYAHWTLGRVMSRRGQHAQAEAAGRKALELNPAGHYYHFWVGYELLAQGEPAAALTEFERESEKEARLVGLVLALPALGRTEDAERVAAEMERDDAATSAANLAAYYACRNDSDRAFAWLDRAYVQHDGYLLYVKGDFCFNNLAHDPRYKTFLRKMNMPE
ncbi:MAG: TIR domain-containing protein [Steroidobacteraceae bacterium]